MFVSWHKIFRYQITPTPNWIDSTCLSNQCNFYVSDIILPIVICEDPPYCTKIRNSDLHDDVIKSKHFPRYWSFVRGTHRSTVNSPHKGQWRRALMFSLCPNKRLSKQRWLHCNGWQIKYVQQQTCLVIWWLILEIERWSWVSDKSRLISIVLMLYIVQPWRWLLSWDLPRFGVNDTSLLHIPIAVDRLLLHI